MNDVFQFLTMRCFNDVSENCQTSCKRCILTMFLWRFLFHAENKKYKCTQCKKNFSPNINLKNHSLVQTGVKPQRCTHCNYSANQGASLKKHILKRTGENPPQCAQCKHTSTLTTTSSNLRSHMMRKHSHRTANSTITLPPLSPMLCKFTWWRTLARSLYVLVKVWPMW